MSRAPRPRTSDHQQRTQVGSTAPPPAPPVLAERRAPCSSRPEVLLPVGSRRKPAVPLHQWEVLGMMDSSFSYHIHDMHGDVNGHV